MGKINDDVNADANQRSTPEGAEVKGASVLERVERFALTTTEALALQRSTACCLNRYLGQRSTSTPAQTSEMQARLRFLSESSQASVKKSLTSTLTLALERLMQHRTPDGRYLMRHRYQWWAVYHVLVRQCGFPDGYREFVACIAQLFPEGLRVPCTESTMKQLSQTRYMQPIGEWRYDALYHGSPERFRLMRETVEFLIAQWK